MTFTTASSKNRTRFIKNAWLLASIALFLTVWIDSLIGTTDLANWFLENTLVFLFLGFLIFTYRKHPFSDLSYVLIGLYLCVHVYGSKYTYAENPFGFWMKDVLHLDRNPYDRLVHFAFGLMLAYPLREMFLRWFKFPVWVAFLLPIELTLSFSTLYELLEWGVADILFPEQGPAYLGTQGDVWDAHKDIFLAIIGAALAIGMVWLIKRVRKEV